MQRSSLYPQIDAHRLYRTQPRIPTQITRLKVAVDQTLRFQPSRPVFHQHLLSGYKRSAESASGCVLVCHYRSGYIQRIGKAVLTLFERRAFGSDTSAKYTAVCKHSKGIRYSVRIPVNTGFSIYTNFGVNARSQTGARTIILRTPPPPCPTRPSRFLRHGGRYSGLCLRICERTLLMGFSYGPGTMNCLSVSAGGSDEHISEIHAIRLSLFGRHRLLTGAEANYRGDPDHRGRPADKSLSSVKHASVAIVFQCL